MPANAAIVIKDGATTPVDHTFTPVDIMTGVARYEDRSTGIAVGSNILTTSVKRPVPKGQRTYKSSLRITAPVLEVSAPGSASGFQPAPTKAFDNLVNIEFVFHERSTRQQRKDLQQFAINALENAIVSAGILDLEGVW